MRVAIRYQSRGGHVKEMAEFVSEGTEVEAISIDDPHASITEPVDVLFIGGALYRVPIVVDGFISALAAYTAARLCPGCECAMLPSHVSAEPAAHKLLNDLGLTAVIHADMRLGEGTGAVCLFPLLDAALALYNGTTFDETGIDAYEVNPQ